MVSQKTPFSPNGTQENQWVTYSKSAVLGVFTNASIFRQVAPMMPQQAAEELPFRMSEDTAP
jgi:hypothetical protein